MHSQIFKNKLIDLIREHEKETGDVVKKPELFTSHYDRIDVTLLCLGG